MLSRRALLARSGAAALLAHAPASAEQHLFPGDGSPAGRVALQDIATARDLAASRIGAPVDHVRTQGYHTIGDGGAALYRRVNPAEPAPDHLGSADGAWWEMTESAAVAPEQFGARADGLTDDAAFRRMFAFVERTGVAVRCAPRTYTFASELELPGNLHFEGAPGTVLDFSAKPEWAWHVDDGLLKARGSANTDDPRRLVAPAGPFDRLRVASASRAGRTVTLETEVDHGLETGAPVYISGARGRTPEAQLVFYTMTDASSRTYTEPVVVTVLGSRTLSFEADDRGDASLTGRAWVEAGGPLLRVEDAGGFAPGDLVFVSADDLRTDGSQEVRIGEMLEVKHVHPATGTLVVFGSARDVYRPDRGGMVYKVNPKRNVRLLNFKVKGKGPNLGEGYGDRGLVIDYVDGFEVSGLEFEGVDQRCILAWASTNGQIRGNVLRFDASDEAGRRSRALDIQYGIAFGSGARAINISDNFIYGGRHAILESSSSTRDGVARDIIITGNHAYGCWLAAISTHQAADTLTIVDNVLVGCESGINIRYGDRCRVVGNTILDCITGVELYNRIGLCEISGNRIRASESGVFVHAPLSPADLLPGLTVSDNDIEGCRHGIYCRIDTEDASVDDWRFDDNRLRDIGLSAIYVSVGDTEREADRWSGSVSGNQIRGAGLDGGAHAIALYNAYRVNVTHNRVAAGAGTLRSRVYIAGAGAAECLVGVNIGDSRDIVTGPGHELIETVELE